MTSSAEPAREAQTRRAARTLIRRDQLRAVLAAVATSSAGATSTRPAPPGPRRVLYVDDNPMLTTLVERIFAADPSVTVLTAPDGRTALSLACQHQPDIVLLDLHLSDMSGETLLQQFQADVRTRSIPAVVVSGDTSPVTIRRLTSLGAVGYLTKPFTAAQLRELVSAVCCPRQDVGVQSHRARPAGPGEPVLDRAT